MLNMLGQINIQYNTIQMFKSNKAFEKPQLSLMPRKLCKTYKILDSTCNWHQNKI